MTIGRYPRRSLRNVVGADPVAAVTKFLRLTPDAEAQLISLMMRGAASRPQTTASQTSAAPGALASQLSAFEAMSLKPATSAEMESIKKGLTNNSLYFAAGENLTRNNPAFNQFRAQRGQGPDWDLGYYIGLAASLGNTEPGPGQDAVRDSMFGDLNNEPMRGALRHKGFAEARALMYDAVRNNRPVFYPAAKGLGRVPGAEGHVSIHAADTSVQNICNAAASALARKSPGAPGLVTNCAAQRKRNVLAGIYVSDQLSPDDPAYRVALTEAGLAALAKNPKMQAFRDTLLNESQKRGFIMAMGVRTGKQVSPDFVAFVKPGLARDPELLKGFLDGMSM